jgi:hypothetical protein
VVGGDDLSAEAAAVIVGARLGCLRRDELSLLGVGGRPDRR